jgi:NAD(P)H-dependent FMN reductase
MCVALLLLLLVLLLLLLLPPIFPPGCAAPATLTHATRPRSTPRGPQAIDWLSRSGPEGASPLRGKPFAVVSAGGGSGGAGGAASVAAICERFKMQRVGAAGGVAVRLFDGTARFDGASGELADAAVRAAVAALVAELQGAAAAWAAAAPARAAAAAAEAAAKAQ